MEYPVAQDNLFLFGALFVAANKLDTLLDRELTQFDTTAKQWFLCVVIESLFQSPPTIKQAAQAMGTSHQNVKQIARKLEEKGVLKLMKDKNDARATRLVQTEAYQEFWGKTSAKGAAFMKRLFQGIPEEELTCARAAVEKMLQNLLVMEHGRQA